MNIFKSIDTYNSAHFGLSAFLAEGFFNNEFIHNIFALIVVIMV